MSALISVIIPTHNEHENILNLISVLQTFEQIEIIVADGGSSDGTKEMAMQYGRVLECDRGRANQMNGGAEQAKGDILWFLHADSMISANMIEGMRNAMKDQSVIGGGFSLRFDDPSTLLRLIAKGSNFRAKHLKLYFGDQGFFIRRSVFEEIGGFPPVLLMEDWLLSRKAKKQGKLKLLPESILTSSRRFRENGIIRTFFMMQKIKFLFLCGVPISRLERMYRHD